ncbi:DUF1476 domain-containing protein [Lichenibacterium ramalinae]|uniref:DUF1476 domain-containing protein n=1 Tax=Lichenibacterium ramalinae TaxID=2316527 RepID=A0A4Q2RBA9_9HYPH|nr:DUF1476 domain-containing protein [Lichenibacterium ramalinae]RYB02906.1 DUF1476 domain-containing protein [Lichenibacterium ramalinae]
MTTFDDRERAFENLFAHDQDLAFRAQARRNRDIGLWAAGQLGQSGEAADLYASQVLMASVEKGGTEAVIAKVREDLARHGVAVSDHQIRHRMDEMLASAIDHVKHD